MHTVFLPLAILASACLAAPQLHASPPQQPGEVKVDQHSYTFRDGATIDYELGTLYVPENRSDPDSRVIGVGFARFPAAEQPPAAPPIFLLPGGPGSSYLSRLETSNPQQREQVFTDFARFRDISDLVLVDQRGFSTRGDILTATIEVPARESNKPISPEEMVGVFEAFARAAADEFDDSPVDLRGYTVIECANDVDQLRQALGYDKLTLNGTSFGSQWSFAVMRLHPDSVARALLSGVEPLNSGYDMPSYVFAALQRMWMTIDEDERFRPYLPPGGMAEAALRVIERLEREPLVIEVTDGEDGAKRTVGVLGTADFPWQEPSQILELYHGRTERWQRQPPSLGMPPGRNQVPILGMLIDSSLSATPQRRHRLWTDPATRYLGRANFALFLATADIWPSPDVGDELRTPVRSDIPVIFAQGDWDTKTPLENTLEIAPFFVNSRVIIAERGGHGVLGPIQRQLPKVWTELEQFLRSGDMDGVPARVRLQPSRRFSPPQFTPDKR